MRKYVLFLLFLCSYGITAQETPEKYKLSTEQIRQLKNNEIVIKKWIESLTTPGVKIDDKKLEFSPEALKMMNDSAYRASVFKEAFSFEQVGRSLSKMQIQKAFWQLINLYPENRRRVIKYIYAYNDVLDTPRVLFSSFYTYAFFDPRIASFNNKHIEILRPDMLEKLHRNLLEIINYISYLDKRNESKEKQ